MENIPTLVPPASGPAPAGRLTSLDALRGFDMFWILGADALVHAFGQMAPVPAVRVLAEQLDHKAWAGFTFFDLIFPLFVFIMGVSLVFSLTQRLARGDRAATVRHILWRALLLFLLGVVYNGGLAEAWPHVRIAGVLQRIAVAYAAGGVLFCYLRPRMLAVVGAVILVAYWALLTFVPIRNVTLSDEALSARLQVPHPTVAQAHAVYDATTETVSGRFEPGLNLTNHLDFEYLPGRLFDKYYDPEGLLSSLPAVVTCLLGIGAGLWLRRPGVPSAARWRMLVAAGVVALLLGWGWHLQFPVVKKLWTSSFVLVAGGWSLLLLAGFHYVVDVRGWNRWCRPFVWIGMNPIALYLTSSVVNFEGVAARFAGGSVAAWFDLHVARGAGHLVVALLGLVVVLALARFLYQRRIFLRV